jgi:hypothetical protein
MELVSAGRLRKAKELLRERGRMAAGSDLQLLDCLQLSDKGLLLLRQTKTRRLLNVSSKETQRGERLRPAAPRAPAQDEEDRPLGLTRVAAGETSAIA